MTPAEAVIRAENELRRAALDLAAAIEALASNKHDSALVAKR